MSRRQENLNHSEICFLKHHATCFWSNLCCTESSYVESRTAPLPGHKLHANSYPVVFFHISLLHQLSKLKATNLLFTSSFCFLNASGLGSSHCYSLLSLELSSSFVTSFPQKRVESVQVFTLSQLLFKCFVYGLIYR